MKLIFILFIAIISLSACSKKCNVSNICIKTSDTMNCGISTFVDLVMIYDKDLLDKLSDMPCEEYFHNVETIYADWYKKIHIYRWEPCPGQTQRSFHLVKKRKPLGVLVFVRYSHDPPHNVSNYTNFVLLLNNSKSSISPLKNNQSTKNGRQNKKPLSGRGLRRFYT